jgi:MYXO-CTERM domain-containing protein
MAVEGIPEAMSPVFTTEVRKPKTLTSRLLGYLMDTVVLLPEYNSSCRNKTLETMKPISLSKILLAAAAAVGLVASASAQPLTYTFDTDAQNFLNVTWSATGPAGWSGGAAVKAPAAVGGWTLGGSFNYYKEFSWENGQQTAMQAIAASGQGHVSFDILLDGTSFPVNDGTWYSIIAGGNSAGANGWTQVADVTGAGLWRNGGDTSLLATHVDLTFAQLGWANPEDSTGWFQLYFGANSASDHPIDFYIDNVSCYVAPEPSMLALAGLGVAALLIRRRS